MANNFWQALFRPAPGHGHPQLRDYDAASTMPPNLAPVRLDGTVGLAPSRSGRDLSVSLDQAMTLDAAYRCVCIITTLIAGLELRTERLGKVQKYVPPLLRKPELDNTLRDSIMAITTSLAVCGEFFLYCRNRQSPTEQVDTVEVMNPRGEVMIARDTRMRPIYSVYDHETGKWNQVPKHQIIHKGLLRLPGRLHYLGPLQAVQPLLRNYVDMDAFAAHWFSDTPGTTGTLLTEQTLNREMAQQYRDAWHEKQDRRDIAVLGSGLKYATDTTNPKDAQYTELLMANAVRVARAYGVPAVAIDASFELSSSTYVNMSQRNQDLLTYTLRGYIDAIEDGFGELLPMGTKAAFHTDTLTTDLDQAKRWGGYTLATGGKPVLTVNEVRGLEGYDPIDGGDDISPTAAAIVPPGEPTAASQKQEPVKANA
jgi:HK97 family phage portal protein